MNRVEQKEMAEMLKSLGEEEFILTLESQVIFNRYQKSLDKEDMKKMLLEMFDKNFEQLYNGTYEKGSLKLE